ncbi:gliding motility-associated C-terminal domain-containing protein [Tunicatimonas pelagia]|uniref:T9SS type B sorting domain-containing protein n=1 Tax=Tunicatimonas pelagia TaxID=931531 RepID=UPI00266591DC|nr:gliding motility-associated C-terminal domain-containing protein [Tunicatimonas pelagia]WKN46124.1 gliding motility-associated C-terminal domain-containing protein [Tunicatimonas pelagia]
MRHVLLAFALLYHFPLSLFAQCEDRSSKIIPDRHFSQDQGFGGSVSLSGDFMAVGDPIHDTLAYDGGAVFLYQRQSTEWKHIATFLPSDPVEQARFGEVVSLTENYLFVSSRLKPHVYVYARGSQWESGTEGQRITAPDASPNFGWAMEVRPDEEKLLISDISTRDGVVYIYSKPPTGWTADSPSFLTLEPPVVPSGNSQEFGRALALEEDLLAVGAPGSDGGSGSVYVYRDQSGGNLSSWGLPAQLHPSLVSMRGSGFGGRVRLMYGNVLAQSHYTEVDHIFQYKPRSTWSDTTEDVVYDVDGSSHRGYTSIITTYDSSLITVGSGSNNLAYAYSYTLNSQDSLVQHPTDTLYSLENFPYLPGSAAVGTDGTLAIGVYQDAHHRQQGGAVWIVPHSANRWVLSQRKKVFRGYYNTSNDFFGLEVHRSGEYLFVGAPFDRRNSTTPSLSAFANMPSHSGGGSSVTSGSVQIYRRRDEGWQKVHELVADDTVVNFGREIQLQGDILYVGANNAKILRFKRGTTDQDWEPMPAISPPNELTASGFGSHFLIRDSIMVVMSYLKTDEGNEVALFVYEKLGDTWQYQSVIPLGISALLNTFSQPVDIYEQTILVTGARSHIIEKSSIGNWGIVATLTGSDNLNPSVFQGKSAVLLEDRAIIGYPYVPRPYFKSEGEVYIFHRTDSSWQDTGEHQRLLASTPSYLPSFGSSLAVVENTLFVGAPRYRTWLDNGQELAPGSVYVFQATDTSAEYFTEVAEIQGDKNTPGDLYGTSLVVEEGELIVGAPADDHQNGRWSGAVYTKPISELLTASSLAVCVSDSSYQLSVEEEGGKWMGPGVVDEQAGTFSPALAGIGNHLLHYQKSGCSLLTPQLIEVVGIAEIRVKNEEGEYIHSPDESVTLSANEIDGGQYEWFYQSDEELSPIVVGQNSSQIEASSPGQYWVTVSMKSCHRTSDTVWVYQCQDADITVYDYLSTCSSFAEVQIHNYQASNQYSLIKIGELGDTTSLASIETTPIVIKQAGKYQMRMVSPTCQWLSDTLDIQIPTKNWKVLPEPPTLFVCSSEQNLMGPLLEGAQYAWYFYESGQVPSLISTETNFAATKTGYYQLVIRYAQCEWHSPPKYLKFHEPVYLEELPNVFTPNGDGVNDTFGIPLSNVTQYHLTIFDRHGKLLYQSNDPSDSWGGGKAPAAVYFWSLRYQDECDTSTKTKKGRVSLIRTRTN